MPPPSEPSVVELAVCRVDLRTRAVLREDRGARLTTREAELLTYFAANAGRSISREELLQEVWGYDASVVSRTADTTIQRLRTKVEADPHAPEHILTEHGHGYRFEPLRTATVRPEAREHLPPEDGADERPTNLRPDASSFVGRTAEKLRLTELFERAPLVTLLGPGGAGKTRLARRFALNALRDGLAGAPLSGGAYFVDLSSARHDDEVMHAVAHALGVALMLDDQGHDALAQLRRAVVGRGDLLLLLDNCEQVIAPTARLAVDLLDAAPRLRLLATSRIALGLPCEQVTELPPLAPDEAVLLFTERAGTSGLDQGVLRRLVAALDHLPLAIELAAGRASLLSPEAILTRLTSRFALLSRGPETAPARHRTLRATLDWSWDLLAEPERHALAACSVFRGSFPTEAAEAVIGGDDALDLLQSLRDRSLLRAAPEDPSVPRLQLLHAVRDYAEERLGERGEADAAQDLHRRWVVAEGLTLVEALASAHGEQAMARLGLLQGDLVAVHERFAERSPEDSVRAALFAVAWLFRQGPMALHQRLLDACLDLCVRHHLPDALRSRVHLRRCIAMRHQGRGDEGEVDGRRACELAVAAGDPRLEGKALLALSALERNRGRIAASDALGHQSLALHVRHGHRLETRRAQAALAFTAWKQGRLAEAEDLYRDVIAGGRDAGDRAGTANALSCLGLVLMDLGRPADAETPLRESLDVQEALRDVRGAAVSAGNLARLSVHRGQLREARAWYLQSLHGLRTMGDRRLEGIVTRNLGVLALSLGEPAAAEEHFRFALLVARETDDPWNAAKALSDLAELLMLGDRLDESVTRYEESLAMARTVGDHRNAAIILGNLSVLRHRQGDLDAAEELGVACLDALATLGLPRVQAWFLAYGALLSAERGELARAEERLEEATLAMHAVEDRRGLDLVALCAAGVRLARARASGTTEQREVADDHTRELAEEPDPDASSEMIHSSDAHNGRRLLQRLLHRPI